MKIKIQTRKLKLLILQPKTTISTSEQMDNRKFWTKEYAFNEQQEISHSLQREILNSFCYDRLTYWKSLNDQGKGVTAMRHKNISAKTFLVNIYPRKNSCKKKISFKVYIWYPRFHARIVQEIMLCFVWHHIWSVYRTKETTNLVNRSQRWML